MNKSLPARNRLVLIAAAVLLACHAVLSLWAASGKGTTGDELQHLTAGYSFWRFHDYRLHPENGILPQRWAALPAWFMEPPFPALEDNHDWRTSGIQPIGHQFLYETGHDHFPMLRAGRAMIVVFNLMTGVLVFCWSRRLFGNAGAMLSVVLFALSPHFLAHGALVTSDACMAFFFLASCGAWWSHLHNPGTRFLMVSAAVFGLACIAKHSAVLLLPMFGVMALLRAFSAQPLNLFGRTFTTPGRRIGALALSALAHGAVAAMVIWACYGFRYEAFNPALPPAAHFIRPWEILDSNIGVIGKIIRFMASVRVLPEAFLYGTAYVVETAQIRAAFLNGHYSDTGWVSFFPWAFALKTTLAVLIVTMFLVVVAAARLIRAPGRWYNDMYRVAPLAILFIVYWAFSLTSHLNIGHRHILPVYPVLFIAAGLVTCWRPKQRLGLIVAGFLAALQMMEAARIAPHFLAYFNPIGGGPEKGHRHLVDSSVDWGQDLPALKTWLDHNARGTKVFLSYFGMDEPHYHRIDAGRLPFVNGFKLLHPHVALEPGIYCVGATMLQHVYSEIRGPWTVALEQEFQQMRTSEPILFEFQNDARRRAELLLKMPEEGWRRAWHRYDQLRFARLCYYLRVRHPDASVGHSIFIYRLDDTELRAALHGSLKEWSELIERAVLAGESDQPEE